MPHDSLSRRSFLALSAAAPLAPAMAKSKHIPVGLELYSVRNELKRDPEATVRAVGQMGYQCVEFYAPYFERTDAQTPQTDAAVAWLKTAMLDAMAPLLVPVPVEVEVKTGRTWGGD